MNNNFNSSKVLDQDPVRIKAKKVTGFLIHLFWFVFVNIILYIFDYSGDMNINWAYWTTFGWGIGIISHGLGVFAQFGIEDKVYQYLNKSKK